MLGKLWELGQRAHVGKAKSGKGRLVFNAKKWGSDQGRRE